MSQSNSNRELRTLAVPEGVAGERIDSALTRVLGLSRTAVVRLLQLKVSPLFTMMMQLW